MKTKNIVLGGITLGGLAGLGYLGYQLWINHKKQSLNPAQRSAIPSTDTTAPAALPPQPPRDSVATNDSTTTANQIPAKTESKGWKSDLLYPIAKGSAGGRVLLIQKALNRIHNAKIDEDAKFGGQTETALKTYRYPTVIQREDFQRLKAMMEARGLAGHPTRII